MVNLYLTVTAFASILFLSYVFTCFVDPDPPIVVQNNRISTTAYLRSAVCDKRVWEKCSRQQWWHTFIKWPGNNFYWLISQLMGKKSSEALISEFMQKVVGRLPTVPVRTKGRHCERSSAKRCRVHSRVDQIELPQAACARMGQKKEFVKIFKKNLSAPSCSTGLPKFLRVLNRTPHFFCQK